MFADNVGIGEVGSHGGAGGNLVAPISARSVGPLPSVDFRTTAPIMDPVSERPCVAAARHAAK